MERHIEDAAAILAALPADWCGHPVQVAKWREMGAEIDRLREALEKIANGSKDIQSVKAARAALEEASAKDEG